MVSYFFTRVRHLVDEQIEQLGGEFLIHSVSRWWWALGLVLLLGDSVFASPGTRESSQTPIERVLAGVEVGGPTEAIEKAHPGIYKHRLGRWSTLWESCNQKDLQVFTFAEESILSGFVASITITMEDDVTVCRDAAGALPDFQLKPETPRRVRLGATEKEIRVAYGEPSDVSDMGGSIRRIRYREQLPKHASGATGLLLVFMLKDGRTQSVSLGLTGPMFDKPPPSLPLRAK